MKINYRIPCSQSSNIPISVLGGCYNTANQNVTGSVKVLKNNTQMITYFTSGPEYLNPYELIVPSATSCATYHDYTCPDRSAPDDNVFCAPPSSSDFHYSGSTFDVGPFKNSYYTTTQSVQLNSCNNVGFKNVFASKAWHGKRAYNSRYYGQVDKMLWCMACSSHDYDPAPDTIKYLSLSANSSMYQKVDHYDSNTVVGGTCCGGTVDDLTTTYTLDSTTIHESAATNNVMVDRYSGNTTVTSCVSSSASGESDWADNAFLMLDMANGDITDILAKYYDIETEELANITYTDNATNSSHNFKCQFTQSCYTPCGDLVSETIITLIDVNVDTVAGTLDIKEYSENIASCHGISTCTTCCTQFDDLKETTYTIGDTNYNYEYNEDIHPSHSIHQVTTYTMDASLSDPYTADDVNSDINTLLGYLPLDNDSILPWRSDSKVTKGPYVHYDESLGIPVVGVCDDTILGTGAVVGKPAPAGIDRVWNPLHKNYCTCTDPDTGIKCLYINTYGAYNNLDINLGSATNWVDDFQASNLVQGAFLSNRLFSVLPCTSGDFTGPAPSDEIWAAKYAEIIFPKQSFNYARPCGVDRFAVDNNSTYCITGSDAVNTVYTQVAATNISTGDYVWVCGSDLNNGCYTVTKLSDHEIQLTTLIASSSLLPSDCGPSDCGSGMIGKLKFQGDDLATAICGYLDINSITGSNSTYITCSTAQSNYLVTGDQITIFSGSLLNGNYTVTQLNSSSFALQGTTYSGPITSSFKSAYAISQFAPDLKWNDVQSKGDFSSIQWKFNYRDIGEYARLAAAYTSSLSGLDCDDINPCTPFATIAEPRTAQKGYYGQEITDVICTTRCATSNACGPSVAFFSPNGETFSDISGSSAINLGWADDYAKKFDTQYGSTWQGIVKQTMDDVYFAEPPCPCVGVTDPDTEETTYECYGSWTEDDGTCHADVETDPPIRYYARRNTYEARCEVPEGAPALIDGFYIGCLNPATTNDFTKGNICSNPSSDVYNIYSKDDGCDIASITVYSAPWVTLIAEEQCICDSGRFSSEYTANGFGCSSPIVSPP